MKKLFLIIISLCSSTFTCRVLADSSFLSGLEFQYLYEDNKTIWAVDTFGIKQDIYFNFLFDENVELGERIAMITMLSSYFEWKKYDNITTNDDEEYFEEYRHNFQTELLKKYKAESLNDKKILAQYRLMSMLMDDFESEDQGQVYPEESKYMTLINEELATSLTAQSIKVNLVGYNILYKGIVDPIIVGMYQRNYRDIYIKEWKRYTEDIRQKVYQKTTDTLEYIEMKMEEK